MEGVSVLNLQDQRITLSKQVAQYEIFSLLLFISTGQIHHMSHRKCIDSGSDFAFLMSLDEV